MKIDIPVDSRPASPVRRRPPALRSRALLAWACVAAHCLGSGWLPALLSAGAALVGNDHAVVLRWNGREAAVVLRHLPTPAQPATSHTHHAITSLLLCLAGPDSPFCADHVVEFGGCEDQLSTPRQVCTATEVLAPPDLGLPVPSALFAAHPALPSSAGMAVLAARRTAAWLRSVELLV